MPSIRDRPILVTGLPRSGTSLVAGCLGLAGAWLGRTVAGDAANPKGFHENVFLREHVTKRLLLEAGCDPRGVATLPDPACLRPVDGLDRVILGALRVEGYAGESPWLYKDAKLTLLWPLWRHAFPEARWVIVRRRREDIIRSCLRTPFMAQHSTEPAFWERFVDAYCERLAALQASGAWCREIRPQDLFEGRHQPLQRLVGELGLEWRADALRTFLEPRHWHAATSAT